MCACARACMLTHTCAMKCTGWLEDRLWKSVHVEPGARTRAVRLGGKRLHLLHHLISPITRLKGSVGNSKDEHSQGGNWLRTDRNAVRVNVYNKRKQKIHFCNVGKKLKPQDLAFPDLSRVYFLVLIFWLIYLKYPVWMEDEIGTWP